MNALKAVSIAVFLGVLLLPIRALSGDESMISNPSLAGPAPKSGDELMARIVAQYRRAMLDRGGWENPYLPSTASGNALASVPVGNGVTLVAKAPQGVSESGAEGAASGEPEEATEPTSGMGQDQVGAASGEPDQESAAGERPEARDRRDFLPTRSGRPSTFWTGSR